MRTRPLLALTAALGGLNGCDDRAQLGPSPAADPGSVEGGGFLAAPNLTGVRHERQVIVLDGTAAPGSRVRLESAAGGLTATTDAAGRWRFNLPASPEARLFGLSLQVGERVVRAQGDVLVTPSGQAAMLLAGGGAVTPGAAGPPRITAFDFDRQGAAIVSGVAPAGVAISLRIDARQAAAGRARADGRFSLSLPQPVAAGPHEVELVGDAFRSSVKVDATPASPLVGTRVRTSLTGQGLRADWTTPGGGVQSTWVLN